MVEGLFYSYFSLGIEHILDWQGYDHMLFLLSLCLPFTIAQWKQVAILVTAFTLGHCLTLALAVYDIIQFPTAWIEFLIPLTIVCNTVFDLFNHKNKTNKIAFSWFYALSFFFGLIHGMGFSNFLRSSLLPGEESQLGMQLFSFNLGIEVGQLFFIFIILLIWMFLDRWTKNKKYSWRPIIIIAVLLWASYLCIDRFPF